MGQLFHTNSKYDYYINEHGVAIRANKKTGITTIVRQYDHGGYNRIQLTNNTDSDKPIKIHYFVHRLVAQAFIDNPMNKPQVNHIDGNKKNNNITNLEWVTDSENKQHAYRTGLMKKNA